MYISIANSIGFALRDSNLPNKDNTLSYEEKYSGTLIRKYSQKFKDTDVVTVQVGSTDATVPTIEVFQPELTTSPTAALVSSYTGNVDPNDDRYYFEFDIDFSLYTGKTIQVQVTQGSTVYLSECLKGMDLDDDLDNGNIVRIDYQNADKPSDYTNFTIDYTTGIAFFMYIEAVFRKMSPQGEDEVIVNINQKVLLEAQLFRGRVLESGFLPDFLIEKIIIAGKHFYFAINDVQFITEGLPDIESNGSNFSTISWLGIHKDVLGFNTDNRQAIGDDMDAVIQRKNEEVTSTWSFVVPKEYMLHEIFASHNVSSVADYVLKAGTTVGGEDLIASAIGDVPLSGAQNPLAFLIHQQLSYTEDKTVYVTITGTGAIADIRAQLILNS
jgi:hypothetical protein